MRLQKKRQVTATAVMLTAAFVIAFASMIYCAASLWQYALRMEAGAIADASNRCVTPGELVIYDLHDNKTAEAPAEDPLEWLKIQCAIEKTVEDYRNGKVGRDELIEVMGYDYDFVVRVVMAESGGESEEMQMAICQCILNACVYSGNRRSPYDVALEDYTNPADYATDDVWRVCNRMFIAGDVYVPALNAIYVYNRDMCESEWHEEKPYVMSLYASNGDEVRFFGEEDFNRA